MTKRIRVFVHGKDKTEMDIEGGKNGADDFSSVVEHGGKTFYLVGCTRKVYLYQEEKPLTVPMVIKINP